MTISYSREQYLDELAKAGKRKRPDDPEHREQVKLFKMIEAAAAERPALKWIHAIPNGGHRSKATAGKLKAEGVTPGVSDIFVPIPSARFHGMYIEMKAGNNKLTPAQSEFGEFVQSRGYSFYTAYSAAEAWAALSLYLGIGIYEKA